MREGFLLRTKLKIVMTLRSWLLFSLSLLTLAECPAQSDPLIRFIENKNQWPRPIDFSARVAGGNMFISPSGFSYVFYDQKKIEALHDRSHQLTSMENNLETVDEEVEGQHVRVSFIDSNPDAIARPYGKLTAYYNYFIGSDSSKWASYASSYAGVKYESIYDGVDMKVYSSDEHIKYDFVLRPGTNPSEIRLRYEGASLSVLNGDLWVNASFLKIIEQKPIAYQVINGFRAEVSCAYDLIDNEVRFVFPDGYDTSSELTIDPLLIFSTYSGSTADNWGSSATPGEKGKLYSTGVTNPSSAGGTFPATAGTFQTFYGGFYDIGILKYDSTGRSLLYASYLGGTESESPHSLLVNNQNELLILGTTSSSNFPTTTNAFSRTFKGGTAENNTILYNHGSDIFITRISQDGGAMLASTFLGGTSNDGLNPSNSVLTLNYGDQLRGDILADASGNVYISSVTSSSDFPVLNSFGMSYKGGATDAVIVKLNAGLTQVLWGAFLGGNQADASHTIKFDKQNGLFVGGGTASTNFPVTAGTYKTTFSGNVDGWIANISIDGSSILSSTFTGTSAIDQVYFIDLNANDEVYAYGQTSGNFPTTSGVYKNALGGQFLQKFSHDLRILGFSTVFGSGRGIPDISPTAFLVNNCDNIYMAGWGGQTNTRTFHWPGSSTLNMPITAGAIQSTTSGSDFYFIVLTADASQLLYSTYLGGTQSRTHVDGGTSRFDKGGIVYHAVCAGCAAFNATNNPTSDFPTTIGAWSRTNRSLNCNNAAFKLDLSSLRARIQTNTINLKSPGITTVCMPDKIVFQNKSIGGKIFEWNLGDGTLVSKNDTSAVVHQYLNPGPYTIKLRAIDNDTCIGKDSTTVVINVYKPLGSASPDQRICDGTKATLSASGGASYSWMDEFSKLLPPGSTQVVSPDKDTRYFVTIQDSHGCVTKDTVKVSVIPGVDFSFKVRKEYNDCFSRPFIRVTNQTEEDNTLFDFGDGTTSQERQVSHVYQNDGIYTIRLVAQREFCTFDSSTVLPFYTLMVPNVITPDGDGKNDTFKIIYGSQPISQSGVKATVLIYNRWGTKVYESTNYQGNWAGEGLQAGTYYYEVTIEGETTCKNWVQLIK